MPSWSTCIHYCGMVLIWAMMGWRSTTWMHEPWRRRLRHECDERCGCRYKGAFALPPPSPAHTHHPFYLINATRRMDGMGCGLLCRIAELPAHFPPERIVATCVDPTHENTSRLAAQRTDPRSRTLITSAWTTFRPFVPSFAKHSRQTLIVLYIESRARRLASCVAYEIPVVASGTNSNKKPTETKQSQDARGN